MELRQYWAIARKWWWLLLLCTVLGAGASYLVSVRTQPTYEASTLIMIGGSVDIVNPDTGAMQTSEKLAQTYAQLLKTRPVLDATRETLGLPETPNLKDRVNVTLVSGTQLLRITVSDLNPVRAAATADELARQLIMQSPSAPQRDEQTYRAFVNQQLKELEGEIADLSEAVMAASSTASTGEMERLQQELSVRRANYSSLLSYTKGSSVNYIQVIELAQVPTRPSKPKVMQNTLLAAVVGLMLAAGVAFLVEYLDDSVKDQTDIKEILELPFLGMIDEIEAGGADPGLVAVTHPRSTSAEIYRVLRTSLRYSLPATEQRVYMFTSVEPGAGKSTTVSNLAIVMTQAGQKVILVDGDLRRPSQRKRFGSPDGSGLTSLLVGEITDVEAALHTTEIPGLRVLPSGPLPPDVGELLGSPRMTEVLQELAQIADVVLVDSPPLFSVADARNLISRVSGVVLVVRAGHTSMAGCLEARDTVNGFGGKVLGVVLNRVRIKGRGTGYGYGYGVGNYYQFFYGDDSDGEKKRARTRRARGHRQRTETEEEPKDCAPEA